MSTAQNSSQNSSVVNLDKAREWCNRARALLGMGLIPYSEDRQMHLRNEAAANGLKQLSKSNPSEFQRLGAEYKAISKEAKAAALTKNPEQSRRVSTQLEILNFEIKQVQSGLSLTELQQLFDKLRLYANDQLQRLESLADADAHRKLTERIENIVSAAARSGDFAGGAEELKLARADLNDELRSWTEKREVWLGKASHRDGIRQAALQLASDSPYRQKIGELLDAAEDIADRVRDYDRAQQLVAQGERVIEEQQQYERPIREKMRAFQQGDPAFIELSKGVEQRLDRLLKALTEEQAKRRLPKSADKAYEVLGSGGATYLAAQRTAAGFRDLVRRQSLEGWGGYPDRIQESIRQLEQVKTSLDEWLKSPTALQNAAIDLVHQQQEQQRQEQALKEWVVEKQRTQTALDELAARAGPASDQHRKFSAELQDLLKRFDGKQTPYDPRQLKQLANRITRAIEDLTKRREALQKEREKVRDRWNELLDQQDVFPQSYYDGISNEYDRLAVYLDSPNVEIVELGLAKRRELLERFERAVANPEKIREGASTLDRLRQQLASSEKLFAEFQPTRLAEHRFVIGELEAVVATEDPQSLLPKLGDLQRALDETSTRAAAVRQTREKVQQLSEELASLGEQLRRRYQQLNLPIPEDYASSYDQVIERHLRFALALEDNARAIEHQQRLEELKTKLEKLLQSDTDVAQYYQDVEAGQVKAEEERRQRVAQQKSGLEQELSEFERGLYKQLNSKLGGSWFLPGLSGDNPLGPVTSLLNQAKKEFAAEQLDAAERSLRQAIASAKSLLVDVQPGSRNQALAGLGKPWGDALAAMRLAIDQLVQAVTQQCQDIQRETTTAQTGELLTIVRKFPDVLAAMEATEFDGFIANILDTRRSDARPQAERALQLVRQRLALAESDPLLQKLAANPFGIRVPRRDMLRALRSLEIALLTVQ